MALSATIFHLLITVSDVDRNVYETLDLRVARHPSESMRYMLTRTLAYCLQYQEGIVFSKGLSTNDEPPIMVRDLQGTAKVWIDVGNPSAERLHKARKAVDSVVVYTQHDPSLLQREAASRPIHKIETIEVFALKGSFLDALEAATDRTSKWELVHTDGQLYVTIGGKVIEGTVTRHSLVA